MGKYDKLLLEIVTGRNDPNVPFTKLCRLLHYLGFEERIRGSHHIFTKDGVEEILNLQPRGNKAKTYQVKQVRNMFLKYNLGGEQNE